MSRNILVLKVLLTIPAEIQNSLNDKNANFNLPEN